jgi:branched-subunit amino acid transport protein AzlD
MKMLLKRRLILSIFAGNGLNMGILKIYTSAIRVRNLKKS